MARRARPEQSWLAILGVSLPLIVIFLSVLSVPLASAQRMGLTPKQTTSWIFAIYALPGLASLWLALQFRQPLILTGNIFAILFIASLGDQLPYPQVIGGFLVAGALVLVVGWLGLTDRLSEWIPAPVVFGVLTGAVVPFVADVFTSLGQAPFLVGATVLAYFLSRRYSEPRVPAILPALLVGLGATALSGSFGSLPEGMSLPLPEVTAPSLTPEGILTVAPVVAVLVTLQANLPSQIFLKTEGYRVPSRLIDIVSGLGTLLGSLFGPTGVSLSLPATALIGGEEAGPLSGRHRSIYIVGGAAVLTGGLAAVAAYLPQVIPSALLLALAGLAVLDVLVNAVTEVARGPLLLGPVLAFTIAVSDISLLGLGPFFWALAFGTAISFLLEREGIRRLSQPESPPEARERPTSSVAEPQA